MKTAVSTKNIITLENWKTNNSSFIVFDLLHVNQALKDHKEKPVHGSIGADILQSGKAIIAYYNHCIYLKIEI